MRSFQATLLSQGLEDYVPDAALVESARDASAGIITVGLDGRLTHNFRFSMFMHPFAVHAKSLQVDIFGRDSLRNALELYWIRDLRIIPQDDPYITLSYLCTRKHTGIQAIRKATRELYEIARLKGVGLVSAYIENERITPDILEASHWKRSYWDTDKCTAYFFRV